MKSVGEHVGDNVVFVGDFFGNGCIGKDVLVEKLDNKDDGQVHDVDEETGDGVGKTDEESGDDEFGEGVLDADDGLGVEFGTKHDGETDDDEDDYQEEVGDVAEGFPDAEDGVERAETDALGVGWLGGVEVVDGVSDISGGVGGRVLVERGDVVADAAGGSAVRSEEVAGCPRVAVGFDVGGFFVLAVVLVEGAVAVVGVCGATKDEFANAKSDVFEEAGGVGGDGGGGEEEEEGGQKDGGFFGHKLIIQIVGMEWLGVGLVRRAWSRLFVWD